MNPLRRHPLPPTTVLKNARRTITTLTRRLFSLPIPPTPPTPSHDSLPSFLAHATRTNLSPKTTTYTGTHYEYTVQNTLRRSAFLLSRTGGRLDAGIDLLGTWHLPTAAPPLRVLVQCKALKAKLGPNLVRELEGTFPAAPPGWRSTSFASGSGSGSGSQSQSQAQAHMQGLEVGGGYGAAHGIEQRADRLGILVSPREATRGVRDALARSTYPLMWMMVRREGGLRQVLWNARAEEMGLGGVGVEVRFASSSESSGSSPESAGSEEDGGAEEVVLTWDGEEIPCMDVVEERMARVESEWLVRWGVRESQHEILLDTLEEMYPLEKPVLWNSLTPAQRDSVLERVEASTTV